MVKKTIKLIPKTQIKPKIIIKRDYTDNLANILDFTVKTFDKKVAETFYNETKKQILLLHSFPNKNPKNRFLEGTENRTYRNIIVKSYYIVYCVKAKEIIVLDIVHQSVNSEKFNKYESEI
jgi:plasmid stabilization system protein ParE